MAAATWSRWTATATQAPMAGRPDAEAPYRVVATPTLLCKPGVRTTVGDDEGNEDRDREIQAAPVATGSKAARKADREAFAQARRIASGEADEGPIRYRLPDVKNREMYAIADQLLGASKMIVMCEDGKSRMARIPGKMKRRQWIKPGDLIIVKPWEIDDKKADVKHRYLRIQSQHLSRRGLIPELLDHGFS